MGLKNHNISDNKFEELKALLLAVPSMITKNFVPKVTR